MADELFDAFVLERGPALLRFAFLLCRDSARAEDLVQEALIRAMRQWRRAGLADHPEANVRRIVVNEYLGWRRRRASTEVVGLSALERPGPARDPSEASDDHELMWQLLGTLSARARAVLVLRYYRALPDREIAAQLGCAEATVRSIAARAFTALRAHPGLAEFAPGYQLEKEA